ncbi:MAG: hypothetical protein QUS09_04450 [Methanotrichaceae archaeon]|nr:hypothetical protein [Methanotrichaceae archaeon]
MGTKKMWIESLRPIKGVWAFGIAFCPEGRVVMLHLGPYTWVVGPHYSLADKLEHPVITVVCVKPQEERR